MGDGPLRIVWGFGVLGFSGFVSSCYPMISSGKPPRHAGELWGAEQKERPCHRIFGLQAEKSQYLSV